LLFSLDAVACRCAPLTLAEYFDEAEQVLMGELLSVTEGEKQNRFEFKVLAPFYKGGMGVPGEQQAFFSTAVSTASCGVVPELGAIYVIFGQAPEISSDDHTIDSCSGTRIHLSRSIPEPQGFEDVPAKFVAQQLNGLAGMEIMKAFSANYPVVTSPTNEHVLGLLDIKAFSHAGAVRLYSKPDAQAQPMLSITGYELLETREVGYEQPSAVVYSVIPGWYRLHLLDGQDAWLAAEQAGTWFPYADLQINRLSYLTRNWSGYVWPEPGAGLPVRSTAVNNPDLREFPVEILEHTEIGGTTWFRVNILAKDPCSSTVFDAGTALAGWIPAYGANGEPNAWFYSRGC
jgi:hypothetical protein